jgi:hypothetical protein
MDLGSIMNLGNFALSLFGAFRSRNASNRQATIYEEQAALNRRIGQFNAEIAEKAGIESVQAVAQQTKRLLGAQMVAFSHRGISLEGSPMFVLGDTLTMGSKQAQEAYFNAEVSKTNYLYGAQSAVAQASSAAESARFKAMSSSLDIFKSFLQGAQMLKSQASIGGDIFSPSSWRV